MARGEFEHADDCSGRRLFRRNEPATVRSALFGFGGQIELLQVAPIGPARFVGRPGCERRQWSACGALVSRGRLRPELPIKWPASDCFRLEFNFKWAIQFLA